MCVCIFLVERVISFFFLDVTRCTVSRASLARPRAKKTGDTPPSHAGVTAVLQGLLLQLTAIGITASGGNRGRRPSFVRRGNSNPQKSAVSAHSGRHHGYMLLYFCPFGANCTPTSPSTFTGILEVLGVLGVVGALEYVGKQRQCVARQSARRMMTRLSPCLGMEGFIFPFVRVAYELVRYHQAASSQSRCSPQCAPIWLTGLLPLDRARIARPKPLQE